MPDDVLKLIPVTSYRKEVSLTINVHQMYFLLLSY